MPLVIQPCSCCGEMGAGPMSALCLRCDEAVETFSEATWAMVDGVSLETANKILLERREQLERGSELAEILESELHPEGAS